MIVGELRPGFGTSRCIFLTRAYLATSEGPGVAVAAAQLRAAMDAVVYSPSEPAWERMATAELKLKRRMRRALERDIETAVTMA